MEKLKLLIKKYGLSLILVIAEIACIVVIFVRLAYIAKFLWAFAILDTLIVFFAIVNTDENPEYKIPWIVIVLQLPPLGALIYVMFSKRKLSRREKRQIQHLQESRFRSDTGENELFAKLARQDTQAGGKAFALLKDDPCAEVFTNTNAIYYPSGERMYTQMLEDLKKAEKFIFMEYFIIEDGVMWGGMLDVLRERAAADIEVRLLYDDIGCLSTLPGNFNQTLRGAGIQCRKFNPFRPSASPM